MNNYYKIFYQKNDGSYCKFDENYDKILVDVYKKTGYAHKFIFDKKEDLKLNKFIGALTSCYNGGKKDMVKEIKRVLDI